MKSLKIVFILLFGLFLASCSDEVVVPDSKVIEKSEQLTDEEDEDPIIIENGKSTNNGG
ncbi:hypothetical protein QQ008_29825 [Fulvivirgaceae bacterium BMA10]|uniref:Uncharacterized protein n=1 Tax=Splendidivirga corallicola TaxID=3051826 RepID=A0ABT8KXS7_9BACT|nr:hypothetical protein [Fulvivirgaceae bacterium BMA10]